MDILILENACKHEVNEDSIYSCLFNFKSDKVLDYLPTKRLLAGFDHLGNAIEVIAIEDIERNLLVVIHAMKLRKKYYLGFISLNIILLPP